MSARRLDLRVPERPGNDGPWHYVASDARAVREARRPGQGSEMTIGETADVGHK